MTCPLVHLSILESACRWQRWVAAVVLSCQAASCTLISDLEVHECNTNTECETLTGTVQHCENSRCVEGCANNHQCAEFDPRSPICPEPGAECVEFTTETGECYASAGYTDATMGSETGKDLLLMGAFAPTIHSSEWLTLQLAVDEINAAGGLPTAGDTTQSIVLVICDDQLQHLPTALPHLVQRLGVRALLTSLAQNELQAALDLPATREQSLLVSPSGSPLTSDGQPAALLWSLGASGGAAAPAYPALIQRLADAAVMRGARLEDLKILSLSSAAAEDVALEDAVASQINLGGANALGLSREDRFRRIHLSDDSVADRADALAKVIEYSPDIVLLFAGGTFAVPLGARRAAVLQQLEVAAGTTPSWQPTYVLGPGSAEDPAVRVLARDNPGFGARAIGITLERRPDPSVVGALEARFDAAFPQAAAADKWSALPNVYAAFYYLAYALAAAPRSTLAPRAEDVLEGLERVTDETGTRVDVGPGSAGLDEAIELLGEHLPFDLYGSSGPARFDPDHGRKDVPQLYCVDAQGDVQRIAATFSASYDLELPESPGVPATFACGGEALGATP